MVALYNEIDNYAADWLENLIAAGHIAPGVVDRRSIVDIEPADLDGYTQVHFFAGIGGWSLAARLAGWPDDRPLWTGSCPCQPFSVAGAGKGQADARHLWPEFHRLIAAQRPPVVMGEQVAAAVGKSWLDGVHSDLEGIGYACGAAVVPACAVDAPHRRDRLWFVADQHGAGSFPSAQTRIYSGEESTGSRNGQLERRGVVSDVAACRPNDGTARAARSEQQSRSPIGERPTGDHASTMGNGGGIGLQGLGAGREIGQSNAPSHIRSTSGGSDARSGTWSNSEWIAGHDGKARRVKPGVRLLAHGVPARVGKLRAFGNAIVPQVAAEIIGAYMDC